MTDADSHGRDGTAGPARPVDSSFVDILLGVIGICAVFVIPFVWWGVIRTLAGR